MAAVVSRFFGYGPSSAGVDEAEKSPIESGKRALPASWYRSPKMYELERRAIFSKRWLLVTHKLRFTKPGDYVRFQEAGFSFFLCLDRQGNLNGFHNICRHRAFPVVTKEAGTAKILSCNYHGWSYGLDGKLAKAPRYDDVQDFDKGKNGLFPVHVRVDALGFVWVNLEASENPSIAWEADFKDVDSQERFKPFDFTQYKFDHTWEMKGDYNWKALADNYNECYHCSTSHPDVAVLVDLNHYYVETNGGHIQHFARPKKGMETEDIQNASTYYFPNACMTVSPHFFYLMRCVPTSATTCSMEYEVFRHNTAADEDFNRIDSFFKRVLQEDKDLCTAAQRNLNAGIFVNGQLHPELEHGPLYFQKVVKSLVTDHRMEEENKKKEIWPASQTCTGSTATEEEDLFCSQLDQGGEKSALAW